MTERKLTKKDYFNTLLGIDTVKSNSDLVAFIEHELELLDRKAKADRKETPKQRENAELSEKIYEFLASTGARYTVGELIKKCPALAEIEDISTSKVTSLLKPLKEGGRVGNIMDKRKSYYFAN